MVGSSMISADWPGFLRKSVEQALDNTGVAIGNVALIGIPGEPFTGVGLGLKEAKQLLNEL